jgi:hypothetical protein
MQNSGANVYKGSNLLVPVRGREGLLSAHKGHSTPEPCLAAADGPGAHAEQLERFFFLLGAG